MILDGKLISEKRKKQLKQEVQELIDIYHEAPSLVVIVVGGDASCDIYVKNKVKAATFCQIKINVIKLDENITLNYLLNLIEKLNQDETIHGIIVQLPLPPHLDEYAVINAISPLKDVDGFGINSKGALFIGKNTFVPATPKGIITLLEAYDIPLAGKNVVVVGRSNIVGKPMALLFLNHDATVTIAHSKTKNLKEITKQADILVVAVGRPNLITKQMVKENAVVVDVGINRIDSHLCGDVDFDEVSKIASYITPVPGGVGPLTVVTLLENTKQAFINIKNSQKGVKQC